MSFEAEQSRSTPCVGWRGGAPQYPRHLDKYRFPFAHSAPYSAGSSFWRQSHWKAAHPPALTGQCLALIIRFLCNWVSGGGIVTVRINCCPTVRTTAAPSHDSYRPRNSVHRGTGIGQLVRRAENTGQQPFCGTKGTSRRNKSSARFRREELRNTPSL